MNYIGSKQSLLPFIRETIETVFPSDMRTMVFCDLFAGTGAVGRSFKTDVRRVISNDWKYYSYVINRNYIGNHLEIDGKQDYIDRLNALDGIEDGFIYHNYCKGSGCGRQYFSDENGKKIDAARVQIGQWKNSGEISDDIYFFLLCSLLESADKYANTASVYGAFLKRLKQTAEKPMIIAPSNYSVNANEHEVFCEDANSLIERISGDVLYLDPPYNARQYGSNYHILNTIAECKPFLPKGMTGLREYKRSKYCSKSSVLSSLDSLLKAARFKYIFLSYNNEGLMSLEDIKQSMSVYGHYELFSTEHQRFKADKSANRSYSSDKTREYLNVLVKD